MLDIDSNIGYVEITTASFSILGFKANLIYSILVLKLLKSK